MKAGFPLFPFRFALFIAAFALLPGCGIPSFLITPVGGSSELKESVVRAGSGRKVVIVEIEGLLTSVKSGGFLQATENDVSRFTQQLDKAAGDSDVAAIVLRINSPGGTVTASDTMYQTLVRFRQKTKKPVIAATQDVAASGAYYVACGADKIVAHPTSVVGSIGVIFNTVEFSGLMGKIGVTADAIKSGPLKDMGSPMKPLSRDERVVMQGMVDELYGRFVEVVKTNRPIKDEATLRLVTDGRVFSGQTALGLGLVDQVGILDDAIDLAKKMANEPNAEVVLYKRPHAFSGSIYAEGQTPPPQSNVIMLNLPPSRATLPAGFYALWDPR